MQILGVSIDSFKAAGGIILILLGVQMSLGLTFPKEEQEKQLAKVLTGLLREVDPNVDPEHIAHLPSTEQTTEENNAIDTRP